MSTNALSGALSLVNLSKSAVKVPPLIRTWKFLENIINPSLISSNGTFTFLGDASDVNVGDVVDGEIDGETDGEIDGEIDGEDVTDGEVDEIDGEVDANEIVVGEVAGEIVTVTGDVDVDVVVEFIIIFVVVVDSIKGGSKIARVSGSVSDSGCGGNGNGNGNGNSNGNGGGVCSGDCVIDVVSCGDDFSERSFGPELMFIRGDIIGETVGEVGDDVVFGDIENVACCDFLALLGEYGDS